MHLFKMCVLALMEEIRLTRWYVAYPIIYKVLYTPGGDRRLSSINSIVDLPSSHVSLQGTPPESWRDNGKNHPF